MSTHPSSRLHPLRGGLALPARKEGTDTLRVARVPPELVLPLDQHGSFALAPCVGSGDRVLLGQVIARPGVEGGVPLHAPVSGTVAAIEPRPSPAHATNAPAIVISNDERDERVPASNGTGDWERLAPEALRHLIAEGGIVGLGGAAFPTHLKLTPGPERPISHLLLNGVECEPFISCDDALMRHRPAEVLLGARILLAALDAERCTVAVEADKPQAVAALRAALAAVPDPRISLVVVPVVYPAGGERQVIAAVTGREVPAGGLPRDLGVVCQNVGTAAAVAALVANGEPLIRRIVTVNGRGVSRPANFDVRLGTPVSALIAECGGYTDGVQRLIAGGSMTGTALPHDGFPVTKATNCVIAATAADIAPRAEEMPCIGCGRCAEVCPAGLLPQALHRAARANDEAALAVFGLADCIECGCCDHVCPSQIPLTATFVAARSELRALEVHGVRSTQLRERYEAHTARLADEAGEKERRLRAKREALRRPPES